MAAPTEAVARSAMTEKPPVETVAVAPAAGTKRRRARASAPAAPRNRLISFLQEHQISLPIQILSLLGAVHTFAPQQQLTRAFLFLSYRNPETGLYGNGKDDSYFVFTWVVLFTLLRAVSLDYIYVPLARRANIRSRKDLDRFSEQAWLLQYYAFTFPLGIYLMYNSPYWLNLAHLWTGWPHRELRGLFKLYYLVQLAFWIQQIYVLHVEKRRKDHNQMFTHHILTSLLLSASYNHYFTRIGHVTLCLMDVTDVIMPIAKMLKYLGYETLCNLAFGLFTVSWFIARHVLYVKVTLSAMFDSHRLIGYQCFLDGSATSAVSAPLAVVDPAQLNSSQLGDIPAPPAKPSVLTLSGAANIAAQAVVGSGPEQCFTEVMQYSFITLLWLLELLALVWFYMIVRVVVKVLGDGVAEDSRSDDEDDDGDGDDSLPDEDVADDAVPAVKAPAAD
ncbi:TLC domain-containing protein [Dipodascopsis tothii]|uniref:TLC domain-containing protein n=1 Tax=Dipodascopsis tothii TaxID=44089 RepID=UPI0034CED4DC